MYLLGPKEFEPLLGNQEFIHSSPICQSLVPEPRLVSEESPHSQPVCSVGGPPSSGAHGAYGVPSGLAAPVFLGLQGLHGGRPVIRQGCEELQLPDAWAEALPRYQPEFGPRSGVFREHRAQS